MCSKIQTAAVRAALLLAAVALSVPTVTAEQTQPAAAAPVAPPIAVAPAPAAPAVDWRTADTLPDVDFSGLSDAQKTTVLKVMREEGCPCGCGMKLAQCRIEDRSCPKSPTVAKEIVSMTLAGKTDAEVRTALQVAQPAPRAPQPPPEELGAPVDIPLRASYIKGPVDAKVTIAEFSDFQCPYCSKAIPWVDSILAAYPKDVRVVFKHFPLPFHKEAGPASEAALAAGEQGKFWQMHDKLFENYRTLTRANFEVWGAELGLDMVKFKKALDDGKFKATVEQDIADGQKVGVRGTPSFYVNGMKYNGGRTVEAIKPTIDEILKGGGAVKPAAKPAADAVAPKPDAAGAATKPTDGK